MRLHDGVDLDVVAGGRRRWIASVETPRRRSRHLALPASLASPTTGSDAMRPRFAQNSWVDHSPSDAHSAIWQLPATEAAASAAWLSGCIGGSGCIGCMAERLHRLKRLKLLKRPTRRICPDGAGRQRDRHRAGTRSGGPHGAGSGTRPWKSARPVPPDLVLSYRVVSHAHDSGSRRRRPVLASLSSIAWTGGQPRVARRGASGAWR